MVRFRLIGFLVLLAMTALSVGVADLTTTAQQARTLKAGFIYVGPIGDMGWTHAHEQGRLAAMKAFPWLQSVIVESVPEGDVETYIQRLIETEKVDVVFTTSFGFMDGTLKMAERYPNKIFFHASGFKRAPNMGTYFADFHQLYYLNGLMAGALTKTGKLGYVGAYPIPEVKRHINAFALGVRAVNPNAQVNVSWIFDWFNPAKAKEAAEALIAAGADGIAFTEDSATVLQVAEAKGLFGFSHYSPMQALAPKATVSGQLVRWDVLYLDILAKIYAGVYTSKNLQNVDYWWLLREGGVELGGKLGEPINPLFIDRLKAAKVQDPILGQVSVYDLVIKRQAQMADPEVVFSPFTGPIKDRKGKVRAEAGVRLDFQTLTSMEWAVEGVTGPWPNEP